MFPFTALLFALFAGAIIVVIIVLLIRSLGRTVSTAARGRAEPLNVVTQLGADGFWLSSFEPGAIIYYQYWSAGVAQGGQVVFQPGGDGRQFVYTGVRPDQVAVVRVESSSGELISNIPPVIQDDSPDILNPILGVTAAQAVLDAMSSAAQPPTPPAAPRFPNAY